MEDRSKRRARLILIAGVLLALVAAVGTFFVASGSQGAGQAAVPTTDVLVAAREIAPKTAIGEADLRVARINSDAVPPSAIRAQSQSEVLGKVTAVPIQAGEFMMVGKFGASQGATFTVFPPNVRAEGGQLPAGTPNYRAMSITVTDNFAVGGALQVGDVIDIMFTLNIDPVKYFRGQGGAGQDARVADFSSKIVLQRVPIIARALTVYTIRTDAATAERLAYLQASGAQLQMLLRAAADDRAAGTEGATFAPVQATYGFRIPERIAP